MRQQIERRIVVEKKVIRSSPLAADDIGSLDGITTEEDGLHLWSAIVYTEATQL